MIVKIKFKPLIIFTSIALILGIIISVFFNTAHVVSADEKKTFIKWVDFRVSYDAMDKALKADVNSIDEEVKLNWVEILA